MPPYFSIGYHQSRWNYMNVDEVNDVNLKFTENNLPLDAIWLDIEHTNSKQYFTFDTDKFPNTTLPAMIDSIIDRGRNLVLIYDPHLSINLDYFAYMGIILLEKELKKRDELENKLTPASGKYLVKDANNHDISFDGKCWPGPSVWPDFL
jgi:alpha 1,3-glucosidase